MWADPDAPASGDTRRWSGPSVQSKVGRVRRGRRVSRPCDPIVPVPPKLQTYPTPRVSPQRHTLPATLNLMALGMR